MKPLIILITTFLLMLLITRLTNGIPPVTTAGRVAMCVMLLFTAIGHFKFTTGMAHMLPHNLPARVPLVYITGIAEILLGAGLLFPPTTTLSGWLLIAFFILLLPANIFAAVKHINYETGETNGPGPAYLWFRIPLQILFILWTYWFAVRGV